MILRYHPSYDQNEGDSSFGKFLKKDLARHPLKRPVDTFFRKIKSQSSIDDYIKIGQIKYLQDGLLEMRIPPVRQGGVVRVYFCYSLDEPQGLIILDAEIKHDRAAQKIERAIERYNIYIKGAQLK